MATRLQRAQASLKREERKADLKRLNQAKDYIRVALEFLKDPFHNQKFESHSATIKPKLADIRQELTNVTETKD